MRDPIRAVAESIADITIEKKEAYGDSFTKSGDVIERLYPDGIMPSQFHDALTVIRVIDKLFRIATRKDAFGESPWRDIAGYAILAAAADEVAETAPSMAPVTYNPSIPGPPPMPTGVGSPETKPERPSGVRLAGLGGRKLETGEWCVRKTLANGVVCETLHEFKSDALNEFHKTQAPYKGFLELLNWEGLYTSKRG